MPLNRALRPYSYLCLFSPRSMVLLLSLLSVVTSPALYAAAATLTMPSVVLIGDSVQVDIRLTESSESSETGPLPSPLVLRSEGREQAVSLQDGQATASLVIRHDGSTKVELLARGRVIGSTETQGIPGWISIFPALLAVILALTLRQVVAALFLGVWLGAWIVYGASFTGLWYALLDTLQVYILRAVVPADGDSAHISVILFSLMIGGLIGIISRNGGTLGIVNRIIVWANSSRRGQTITATLGLAVFFDDYANTLVVGNTMRPISDRLLISREKLAYLVDSTAAPVSCIALVTTWIGFEVGLIDDALSKLGSEVSAYSFFLSTIPYAFYPIFALVFVFFVALSGRDFGPMYRAEQRARSKGQLYRPGADLENSAGEEAALTPPPNKARLARNAVIPVGTLVVATLLGLFITGGGQWQRDVIDYIRPDVVGFLAGEGPGLRAIIGDADSYQAILWASLISVLLAMLLSVGQRILSLKETIEAWFAGLKSMLYAVVILILAWALADINAQIHTADFLVAALGPGLAPEFIPAGVFVLAALTAFATGSSWGTMGILIPLVLPLCWAVLTAQGAAPETHVILYAATSAVLAGAVWGDHCSPISDTTILSSMATGCDHVDHVNTQMPYALLVGGTALLLGLLPVGYGLPWYVAFVLGILLLGLLLRFAGRKSEGAPATAGTPLR